MAVVLSLDAMGGDRAPEVVLEGARLALERGTDVHYLLFGDEKQIKPLLNLYPSLQDHVTLCHAEEVISSTTKPAAAIRGSKRSSMRLAIEAVAKKEAAAVVSAGNTGAYMALAKMILKSIPGIDRPAIASIMPTIQGKVVMLDLGANVESDPHNLVQFAIMGEAFSRQVLSISQPKVGLLNVGSEDLKGHAVVKEAATQLKAMPQLSFLGFIEGDDIAQGTVDVVVTDGFTGNISLKSIEGTARFIRRILQESLMASWRGKLGYLIAKPAFALMQKRVDPRLYNGAIFLGLQGVAVKSHGGTDALGFSHAIRVAADMASRGFIQEIERRLQILSPQPQAATKQKG
jgi:glycerol-3-phosphate acyltransferase PlsX